MQGDGALKPLKGEILCNLQEACSLMVTTRNPGFGQARSRRARRGVRSLRQRYTQRLRPCVHIRFVRILQPALSAQNPA